MTQFFISYITTSDVPYGTGLIILIEKKQQLDCNTVVVKFTIHNGNTAVTDIRLRRQRRPL